GDLDVAHAVLRDQQIDLADDALRTPEAIAVRRLLQSGFLLAGLERRLNAAERAGVRTPERRVDRRVRLARVDVVEAVPGVRAVLRHGQQVPREAGHLLLDVPEKWRRGIRDGAAVLAIDEAADLRQLRRRRTRIQCLEQIDDSVQSFVPRHEVASLLSQRLLG